MIKFLDVGNYTIIMSKFEVNQIIWARLSTSNIQWPGKIVSKKKDNSFQVFLINKFPADQSLINVKQSYCKLFEDYCINEKDSPNSLYQAFKMAKKQHQIFLQNIKQHSPYRQKEEQIQLWNVLTLSECLDNLLCEMPKNIKLDKIKQGLLSFQLKQEEIRKYISSSITQKLSYLMNKSQVDSDLYKILRNILEKMKKMLVQAFKNGNL